MTLVRQDTFNLEKEEFQAKLNHKNRARSSYGIDAILERAEQMSSLAPEVIIIIIINSLLLLLPPRSGSIWSRT